MATKTSKNIGLRFVENAFGALGYLLSGIIAAFILILAFYYACTIFAYAPPTIVSTTLHQSQAPVSEVSFTGVLFVAFTMIVTFLVIGATILLMARVVRWFVRACSISLHIAARLIFQNYTARQLVLVKSLVFAVEAGILLAAYILYPSVLLLGFLVSGAVLLVASLLCVAIQAVVVLSTRRAPADIL